MAFWSTEKLSSVRFMVSFLPARRLGFYIMAVINSCQKALIFLFLFFSSVGTQLFQDVFRLWVKPGEAAVFSVWVVCYLSPKITLIAWLHILYSCIKSQQRSTSLTASINSLSPAYCSPRLKIASAILLLAHIT